MDGQSNLSRVTIEKFAKALKLTKDESEFFRNLVLFNQATASEEKRHYAEEILKHRAYRKVHPLKEYQYNCFNKWFYIPLRSFVELQGFREDPKWISARLKPQVPPGEIKKALEELLALGLLTRDENGKLIVTEAHVSTPDEVTQSPLAHYHREMLRLAGESIDAIPRESRDISALTVGISAESAAKVKKMIQDFRRKIVEAISEDKAGTAVYQINFQLFPVIDITGAEASSVERKPHEKN